MTFIDKIPDHVFSNMSYIQDNLKSIVTENFAFSGSDIPKESVLSSTFSDIMDTFSDVDTMGGFGKSNTKMNLDSVAGVNGNKSDFTMEQMIREKNIAAMQQPNQMNPIQNQKIDDAYKSLLNGESENQTSPLSLSSLPQPTEKSLLEKLNKIKAIDSSASLVTDDEFFNAEALKPAQINEILRKKNSPYAYQKFDGKTVGELIYAECHKAGTANSQGPKTINPAMIVSIMGAESGFGTDPTANKANPFNIRINGSFDKVGNFKDSLSMAVNTMYNWGIDKPKDSKISTFDYAGDKYCENYTEKWKPNVEKYYLEFSIGDTSIEDSKQKLMSEILSQSKLNSKGLNMNALLQQMSGANSSGSTGEQGENLISNMTMSAMNSLSALTKASDSSEESDDSFNLEAAQPPFS